MDPSTLRVTIRYNRPAKADRFRVEVFPVGTDCSDPDAFCTQTNNTSFSFEPNQLYYTTRVRALNNDCGTEWSPWSIPVSFVVHAPVTGTQYLDNDNTAGLSGGVCATSAALDRLQAGNSFVTIQQNGEYFEQGDVDANADYQASAPYWDPGNNIVQMHIGESALYTCTCPAGCVYSGISTPQLGVNFYLIEARDPWFQIEGGPITALSSSAGNAIRNFISDKCSEDPDCQPYLITRNNDVATSSGYIVTGGGSVDLAYLPGDQTNNVDEDGRNIVASATRRVAQENYEYFIRQFKFPEVPIDDFATTALNAQKPTLPPANSGVNAYYHNGDLQIQDQWDVGASEEISVFVNGDVLITNQIQTEVGGFLAIFASGDIVIDPNVENTVLTDRTGLVEGVFVANGQIILPSRGPENGGDGTFVGEGTFVGWNGIILDRDFDDFAGRKIENNHKPTEIFRYRSDFLLNAPDEIRVPRYRWQEVAP